MLAEDLPESMLAKEAIAAAARGGQKSHSRLQGNEKRNLPTME